MLPSLFFFRMLLTERRSVCLDLEPLNLDIELPVKDATLKPVKNLISKLAILLDSRLQRPSRIRQMNKYSALCLNEERKILAMWDCLWSGPSFVTNY
jgi:hypothetical protein